jgi:hypothetical protein
MPRCTFDDERPLSAILRKAGVEHKSDAASRRTDDPVTDQPPPTPLSGMLSQRPPPPFAEVGEKNERRRSTPEPTLALTTPTRRQQRLRSVKALT